MDMKVDVYDALMDGCTVCGSSNVSFWRRKSYSYTARGKADPFDIFRCGDCGSGFLNPPPSPQYLRRIYATSGHALTKPVTLAEVQARERAFPNTTIDAERLVRLGLGLANGKQRGFDIGSGYGFATKAMRGADMDVVSINPGAYENTVFRELNGRDALPVMLGDYEHAGAPFDLVVMSQVLEHLVDPASVIKQVRAYMTPGGVIACAVPNFRSAAVAVLGTKENGCLWVPEHVNYFTEAGLRALFRRCGFEVVMSDHITRVPYDALSKRLRFLPKGPANSLVKHAQKPIAAVLNHLGRGTFINVYARKVERAH